MNKTGIKIAVFGFTANFILFLIKLYIGVSSNSLCVYCDSINNLADTFSCIIALIGFCLMVKLDERRGKRTQSLISFVIGAVLAATGVYFAYSGAERIMYPTLVSYSETYAILLLISAAVKLAMGFIYRKAGQKSPSPVIKTLTLDSFTDFFVTLGAFLGFTLADKINFAIDGIMSIAIGLVVAVCAVKTVIDEAKFLIND